MEMYEERRLLERPSQPPPESSIEPKMDSGEEEDPSEEEPGNIILFPSEFIFVLVSDSQIYTAGMEGITSRVLYSYSYSTSSFLPHYF